MKMAGDGVCRQTHVGFTLVEVLIALAVTGMLVSMLMSSVFYGAKVQVSIQEEMASRESSLRVKTWFVESIGACLPLEQETGSSFVGTIRSIACESAMPLNGGAVLTIRRLTYTLQSKDGAGDVLMYTSSEANAKPQALYSLPAGVSEFVFVDATGKESPAWPVVSKVLPEALPRRIYLRTKSVGQTVPVLEWTVALRATPWLEPVLKNPFGLGLPR